jgi:organic hydroperoxide reductase OsmC/OhrA
MREEMIRRHSYALDVQWTGNSGSGTSSYASYSRNHEIAAPGKPLLACSADPAFRGDPTRYNPEELFLASLSACHMLTYLHLCADAGITVVEYTDHPEGVMEEGGNKGGKFVSVTLHPTVAIRETEKNDLAFELHEEAHKRCFIANSTSIPVHRTPTVIPAD